MAIHAQILIGSRKDEEAIDWSKGFGEAFIGQGKNKLKEVMEAYQGREDLCVIIPHIILGGIVPAGTRCQEVIWQITLEKQRNILSKKKKTIFFYNKE
ncbi:unnamed protein product [Sphagnum troendelagicum]